MPKSDNRALHKRLTLNSISNLGRYLLSIVIAFFLTPFIVRNLGDSLYGFWILLMSFIGYASILEMGVQPAVVKLVGQYRGTDDRDKLHELIAAALVFFSVVGAFAAVVIITLVPTLIRQNVDGLVDLPRPTLLFAAIAADAMVMYMNYLFTGILHGWQRYHLKNLIEAAGWGLNAGLVVAFLPDGGLLALVACKLAKDIFVLLGSVIAVFRVVPDLRFGLGHLNRASFKELMGFGGRVFISATTTRIATHSQPVIISTALTSAATSFYAIPVKLVDYGRQVAWALSAGFMPMFSELAGKNDRDMLRAIYLRYTQYIFVVLIPIPVMLFVYGKSFIALWIGPEYATRGATALTLLASSVLIESFHPLVWRFFIGVGHLNFLVKVSAAVSVLVVVASVLLVRPLEIAGVALSVLLGAVLAQTIYATKACHYLGISVVEVFLRIHVRVLVSAAIAFLVALAFFRYVGADDYLSIVIGVLPSLAIYAVLCLRFALGPEERNLLREKLPWGSPAAP